MQESHREAIRSNYMSLVERTDLVSMVNTLFEKGVFSAEMIEPYLDTNETARERKRKLYRDIMRRGPQAFDLLIEALTEMGHWDLVRDLDPNTSYRIPNVRPILNPIRTLPKSNDVYVSVYEEKNRTKTEVQKNYPMPAPPTTPPPTGSSPNNNVSEDNNDNKIPLIPEVPFVVEKSKKFIEDDPSKDIKLYRTRGLERGRLYIFSYVKFKNNVESYRSGADVDCHRLRYLFLEMGFRVFYYNSLTLEETMATLQEMKVALQGVESVFVVMSSHGYERSDSSDTDIRCSDGKLISLYQVIEYFSNRNLPHLIDIPKVFIFQICRGTKEEWAMENKPPPEMPMPWGAVADGTPIASGATPQIRGGGDASPRHAYKARLYSNILIAHSTLPGFVSHRDPIGGSWYIQVLCEVFAERAHDCHVDKLFTMVDERLKAKFNLQTSSIDRWGFNKKLYLHPGLFE